LIRSFFVQEAEDSQRLRLRKMFVLAWDGKGFSLNLERLRDADLELLMQWRNERVEEENSKAPPGTV
jgi:hypothetical protein